jgi:hypothetical protein
MRLGFVPCMYPTAQACQDILASPCVALLSDSHHHPPCEQGLTAVGKRLCVRRAVSGLKCFFFLLK